MLFGLPLGAEELATYRACTGRETLPAGEVFEAWLCCGRRAGKSFILALVAVFLATMRDWSPYLAPGERGTICIVSADRRQSRTIFRFISALLNETILRELVEREVPADGIIDLTNGISIEIQTASFRTSRGYTLIAALCDEAAFWITDEGASNPDVEIIAALRPAMATVPGSRLLVASSPYRRRGALWDAYRKHYGKDGSVLVWQAPTLTMNPTVPASIIDDAYEADPANAAAEYGASFRADLESAFARELVESCVVDGRFELEPQSGVAYAAGLDPAGGSGGDLMALSVAYRDKDGHAVQACVREKKPKFSPEAVVAEFVEVLKSYRVKRVVGDHWGGEFVREPFARAGITYQVADKTKSEFYLSLLPAMNSGKIELLDNKRLIGQFCGLERKTRSGGRDSVDHAPNQHDDICNATAIALMTVLDKQPMMSVAAMKDAIRLSQQRVGAGTHPMFGERAMLQRARARMGRY